jgi:hypothetical protein
MMFGRTDNLLDYTTMSSDRKACPGARLERRPWHPRSCKARDIITQLDNAGAIVVCLRKHRTQLHRMKYIHLSVDAIRQDPALTLELKVVIAVELGEAPERRK